MMISYHDNGRADRSDTALRCGRNKLMGDPSEHTKRIPAQHIQDAAKALAGDEGISAALAIQEHCMCRNERNQRVIGFSGDGYVEYTFFEFVAARYMPLSKLVVLGAELCSEAAGYQAERPSDITPIVNGWTIGTYTSPGDLGDRKGKLSPQIPLKKFSIWCFNRMECK